MDIAREIEKLGRKDIDRHWHQRINIGEVWTCESSPSSPHTWEKVRELLPKNLKGVRILDIGCNAGLFCLETARLGAEVVGIEPNKSWFRQAIFVRDYFERVEGVDYELYPLRLDEFIRDDNYDECSKFDYVIALAVLRLIPPKLRRIPLREITRQTNNFILRENKLDYWKGFFEGAGMRMAKKAVVYNPPKHIDGCEIHLFTKE